MFRRLTFTAIFVFFSIASAWEMPVNLGGVINTEYNEWYPVLARDGSFRPKETVGGSQA